jgi:cytochrome c2
MRARVGSLLIVAALVLGAAASGAAQGMTVDAAKAKRGKTVFNNRCLPCHTIGKGKAAGPDLKGVFERRNEEWVRRWLKNTTDMLASDSTAMALLTEYRGMKMPDLKLPDSDIDAVINFLAQATATH